MSIGMLIALIRRLMGSLHLDYTLPFRSGWKPFGCYRFELPQWCVGRVLWLPWLAVVSQALLGVDIYRSANTTWLLGNVLFGVVLLSAVIWVSKQSENRWTGLHISSV